MAIVQITHYLYTIATSRMAYEDFGEKIGVARVYIYAVVLTQNSRRHHADVVQGSLIMYFEQDSS